MSVKTDFLRLRKAYIENEYKRLNDMQRKAVLASGSPLLILAGAGSGKTTVIVEKIACLLRFGDAYNSDEVCFDPTEADVAELEAALKLKAPLSERLRRMLSVDAPKPWQVLAITFTNKAANELKERIALSCGADAAQDVWASTFHSACVRILRREIEALGYSSAFTIYDADDSKRVIKEAVKALGLDGDYYKPAAVAARISAAKSAFIGAEEYAKDAAGDVFLESVAKIYARYAETLKKANAVDFDDIINLTVRLFREFPDRLAYWREKFRFVLVDEYQDTNAAQFLLVYLLTKETRSVCVVGDDDQSIYKFRGATIRNILDFEKYYPEAVTIRLEQNYRSTGNILAAANAVIANNLERKGKNLWTEKPLGEKITLCTCADERGEGDYVAACILKHQREGGKLSDCAVLYRTNAQAAQIEQSLNYFKIPNRVIGGTRFFERREIKDVISYLCVIANPSDDLRLKRIINLPKRGIGDTTVEAAERIAAGLGEPIINVIREAENYPDLERSKAKLAEFCALLDELTDAALNAPFEDIVKTVAEKSGYMAMLAAERDRDGLDRADNVLELGSMLIRYKNDKTAAGEEATLTGFLEDMSLVTDIDDYDKNADAVVLMTLHNAKGLEFNVVFITGLEEELFPSMRSYDDGEIEEERRLMYVGVTRAREKLYLTRAEQRLLYGATRFKRPSRFLEELPREYVEKTDTLPKRTVKADFGDFFGVARSTYAPKRPPAGRPPRPSASASAPKAGKTFSVGDRVKHAAFGEGTVVSAMPMGNDTLLEVNFTVGKKKIMANFAPIEKI
ncbi:MAG: UvrD-helicase domain-containing protein [Clostridia bacterium]|nr:UvrD-helicase domain-containing protein [Clostridia bacterium]